MKENHIVILDQIGRTILGTEVSQTETELTLYNPIVLNFQPSPNGQLELQVFPLFFFELLDKDKRTQNSWTYNKSSIVVGDVQLNADILARYSQINTPAVVAPPAQDEPKIISIDDI